MLTYQRYTEKILNKVNRNYWIHDYMHHIGAALAFLWLFMAFLSFIGLVNDKYLNLLEPLTVSWAFVIYFTNHIRLKYKGEINLELKGLMIGEQKEGFVNWVFSHTIFGVVEKLNIDSNEIEIWSNHASRSDVQQIRSEAEKFRSYPKGWVRLNNPEWFKEHYLK